MARTMAARPRIECQSALWWPFVVTLAMLTAAPACAQHAADNPVLSAEDAFGLTLGTETIGLYTPQSVRGFNPQTAGNARIDGLYFDQQGSLSNRVIEASTIRVGFSEIGYVFPAPTGIVDYDLRHATPDKANATVIASSGPYNSEGVSVDGSVPIVPNRLLLPIGASYQISTQTVVGNNPGYSSRVANVGATPEWIVTDRLSIRGLFDWTESRSAKTLPVVFTAGDFLPPRVSRSYHGQDWALGENLAENLGAIVTATLSGHWTFAAGVFRSVSDSPVSFSDLYVDTSPQGLADHQLVGYPDQRAASTSGEARLTAHWVRSSSNHEIVCLARVRDELAHYGGSDVIETGLAFIGQGVQVTEPAFHFSALTSDRTRLWSTGVAYRGRWSRYELSLGLQRESYDKVVASPGSSAARLSDRPWRIYGTAAATLAVRSTWYAGYTQGLEDSGTAPGNAENRGAILPAARTWQAETGVRYLTPSGINLIAGVFEVRKPYFNLDASNFDRQLATQQARGLELSVNGEVARNLNVNLGAEFGAVKVSGPNLQADGIGSNAFGQPHSQIVAEIDYTLPSWTRSSLDIGIVHLGAAPASVDGRVSIPAFTLFNIGGRYKTTLFGAPATLRMQMLNAPDMYIWTVLYSPGFYSFLPRAVVAYLTVDI